MPLESNALEAAVKRRSLMGLFVAVLALALSRGWPELRAQAAVLPSWNDGASKQAIVTFVTDAVARGGTGYIAPADRVAVFDNDGTLWAEQPIYVQLAFVLDGVKALAPQHPEWKTTQPFKAVLEGDMKAITASGEKGLVEMVMATHAGMTTDEFAQIVLD